MQLMPSRFSRQYRNTLPDNQDKIILEVIRKGNDGDKNRGDPCNQKSDDESLHRYTWKWSGTKDREWRRFAKSYSQSYCIIQVTTAPGAEETRDNAYITSEHVFGSYVMVPEAIASRFMPWDAYIEKAQATSQREYKIWIYVNTKLQCLMNSRISREDRKITGRCEYKIWI